MQEQPVIKATDVYQFDFYGQCVRVFVYDCVYVLLVWALLTQHLLTHTLPVILGNLNDIRSYVYQKHASRNASTPH